MKRAISIKKEPCRIEIYFTKMRPTLVFSKPSAKSVISAIIVESGVTIAIGRNIDFKLSGSSVRPAYPGFIVIKMPQDQTSFIIFPSNMKRMSAGVPAFFGIEAKADSTARICCATTDNTSMLMLHAKR